MTFSPYDSLPSGNNDIQPEAPKKPLIAEYTEVDLKELDITPTKTPLPPKPIKTKPLPASPHYDESNLKSFAGCSEFILPFEETLLVPDTMADMRAVLFAEGRVDITPPGKSTYDRNDFLAGNITVFTVYKPTDVVKSIIPFKTDKCWAGVTGDSFRVNASIKKIDADMINERKFIVKGELLIKIFSICDHKLMHYSDSNHNDILTCKKPLQATVLKQEFSDAIEISQEITVSEDLPRPTKILKTSVNIVENHRQITSGKLILNASVHYQILYLGEKYEEEKEPACASGKTDFSQFIIVDEDTDPGLICLAFKNDLDAFIENNGFLLKGNITTLGHSYYNKSLDAVCDAYHKNEELLFDVQKTPLDLVAEVLSGEVSSREVVSLSEDDKKPAILLCGSCNIISQESSFTRGQIVINSTVKCEILALDDEDSPFVINQTFPVKCSLDSSISSPRDPKLCIDTAIKDFWFGEINARQLELNITLSITARAITKETFCTIDNLRFADSDSTQAGPSMGIYVVGEGESLWDVAKRYKCDVSHLAMLNGLDPSNTVPAGTKLFCQKHV